MLPAHLLQLSDSLRSVVLAMDSFLSPRRLLRLALTSLPLISPAVAKKNLIVDTDLFSDVDDAGGLLLAATSPDVNLLAVNVNYPSSYSVLAASAIVAHYGHADLPIGIVRPLTNDSFFDDFYWELGEYASKVAHGWSDGSLLWGEADNAWDPVTLYRKILAGQEDGSVTIASIGFFDNVGGGGCRRKQDDLLTVLYSSQHF